MPRTPANHPHHAPRRRSLLAAAGLVSAAVSLGPLTGCGSGARTATDQSGEDEQPRRGGRLRATFAGGGANETLDPHRANLFVDVVRAKAVFDKLADYADDMSAEPRLAESWEPNGSLDRWRVSLRDAAFHDGRRVTAADVLYSFRRIADPDDTFRAKADLELIDLDASGAEGDRVVEFRLKRPSADFPAVLATFGAYVVPEGTTDFDRPVGSGPFRLTSFAPGRSAEYERNDDYWDGAPYLDALEITVANEESARVNALLGGQVEYAHELNPATARAHEDAGQVRIVRLANSAMQAFVMKTDRPPFDDPRVRQAFFLIADRQELIDGALSGAGEVGNDLFGRGYQYYADSLPQRRQDLARARELLRAAGAENLEVTLDTSDVAMGFTEAAAIFRDQAAAAGVTVTVRTGNPDSYWADILDSGTLACYRSGAMPIGTHISQRLLRDSPTNATQWRRADFDELYQQTQATADEAERTGLYERLQRQLHDEGGFLVWGFADWILGTANHVRGVSPTAPANSLDWARFDKVWLA
ncbi:ABC transporter substrate-binding protein [Streptomyces sp. 8K308]|uniref:ABC transporter substrate-binding protein n=1 Tax=Streptomyces sp. 8K308 TaxID=2530388 RepID=UPI00104A9E52|nr:ABC transporter substrate-binding protein [Streptomyces sp. 8K308]TDC05375.1 ABC transporter substrate-binding protein [Streptomyces sp. 8K308]